VDQDHSTKQVDPVLSHPFVERLSQPFSGLGGAYGSSSTGEGVGVAFKRRQPFDNCELCEKRRTDPIHEAAEQAGDAENWPV
jgi:hypothetical protein